MANTVIQLKYSGVPGNVPPSLSNGEIALNYADGKFYYKNLTGQIVSFSATGNVYSFATINANNSLITALSNNSILNIRPGQNIGITTDIINDIITISADLKPAYDTANAAYNYANTLALSSNIAQVTTLIISSYNQANQAYTQANSKTFTFFQSTAPSTANANDLWANNITGVVYENFGNTTNPIWAEFGPTGTQANINTVSYLTSSIVFADGSQQNTAAPSWPLTNTIYTVANSAYDMSNAANVLAFDTGIGANAWTNAIVSSANSWANTKLANTSGTLAGDLTVTGNTSVNKQIVVTYKPAATINAAVHIAAANTKGTTGYADVLKLTNLSGGTNIDKWIRLNQTGGLEIINNAYNTNILTITDSGDFTVAGNVTMSGIQPGYSANRPGFRVYGSGTTNNLTTTQNGTGRLTSNNFTVVFNQGSYLNTSNGVFTAPVAGLYQINIVGRNSGYAGSYSQIAVIHSGAIACMLEWAASSTMNHVGASAIVKMAVGETLVAQVLAGQVNFDSNDHWSVAYIG